MASGPTAHGPAVGAPAVGAPPASGSPAGGPAWEVVHQRGRVRELHEGLGPRLASAVGRGARAVSVLEPTDRAVVVGSAQPLAHVDLARCSAAGVDVVRRRSGGGAVLVEPGSMVWVDVVVPAGDPLWCADVGRATWWLGEAWVAALSGADEAPVATGASGADGAGFSVWRGPLQRRPWSERVCFAGLGPGEVVRSGTGTKVVGISQRRVRGGAAFQCACLLRWRPHRLVELLALSPADRARAGPELATVAGGVGAGQAPDVLGRFLASLP